MNAFEMDYYKTYYFANICNLVMEDSFEYLRTLNEFWGDGKIEYLIKPYSKHSTLHKYIEFCIDRLFYESNKDFSEFKIEELEHKQFWINETLDYHNIEHLSFWEWYKIDERDIEFIDDLIYKYLQEIEFSDFYDKLKSQMIDETFFILFLNRKFLRKFNLNISGVFELQNIDDFNVNTLNLLTSKNRLKRKKVPVWARKAVFYRDRGKCTYCQKDLTGLINIENSYHIDHIVPLNIFGINDVSNLQLLCESCNTSKGSKHSNISKKYEKWY